MSNEEKNLNLVYVYLCVLMCVCVLFWTNYVSIDAFPWAPHQRKDIYFVLSVGQKLKEKKKQQKVRFAPDGIFPLSSPLLTNID